MGSVRVAYLGLVSVYLVGIVAQFFLAGLGVFEATSWNPHMIVGYVLIALAVLLAVLAFVGKLPRPIPLLTVVVLLLNLLQIVFAHAPPDAVAALHVVNALAIFVVAHALMQRARGFVAERVAD